MADAPRSSVRARRRVRRWTFQSALGALVKTWTSVGVRRSPPRVRHSAPASRRTFLSRKPLDRPRYCLPTTVVYGDRLGRDAEQLNLLGQGPSDLQPPALVRVPDLDFKGNPKSVEGPPPCEGLQEQPGTGARFPGQPDVAGYPGRRRRSRRSEIRLKSSPPVSPVRALLNRPTQVTLPDGALNPALEYNEANSLGLVACPDQGRQRRTSSSSSKLAGLRRRGASGSWRDTAMTCLPATVCDAGRPSDWSEDLRRLRVVAADPANTRVLQNLELRLRSRSATSLKSRRRRAASAHYFDNAGAVEAGESLRM